MISTKASATHTKVQKLLDKGLLYEAYGILNKQLANSTNRSLKELLSRQEETYRYMLHYLVEGFTDTSRDRMLGEIKATLGFINDSILRDEVLFDSSDIYSSTFRFEKIRKATLQSRLMEYKEALSMSRLAAEAGGDVAMTRKTEEALSALFSYVWTMFGASSDDYTTLVDAVKDPDMPFEFRSQVVSALMLGNMTYYDRKGLSALLDIFEADIDQYISARALTAIVLIVAAHKNKVTADTAIKDRLSLWSDSIIIYRQLREVAMTLIRAHDTQRISSKMQNEVIPELMKLRPEIIKKLGKISEAADLESLEVNPEWEDIINKNGLGDKLKELTDMQMDGGDVMMLAFSNLKSFPFFNSVANWFLPFSSQYSEVSAIMDGQLASFSDILDTEGVMCDSDKYSFAFSLSAMPESQRNMMANQMSAQFEQLKEALADRKLKSSLPEFDRETTRYVRDIYRFFKLFRKKADFADPFITPIDFGSLPVIGEILADEEILHLVGEFYFKRGYYAQALPLFLHLDKIGSNDHLLWEKIGYSYNALGKIEKALEWYTKAELFNPDSLWLIRRIALCNRLLNNHETAAEYYAKALQYDPENYNLLVNLAHSQLETGKLDEARANYFHADYLKPDKLTTWRGIAWTELLAKNFDKSLEYYSKILANEDSKTVDSLNQGHAYFLAGNYKKALESYLRCANDKDYGLAKLEEAMSEDLDVIVKAGGNASELKLLLEKIRYDMKA